MEEYLNIEIERDYSRYPRGLKHFKKEEIIENSLFDIDLMSYKLTNIIKGGDTDEETDKTDGTETCETPQEIL